MKLSVIIPAHNEEDSIGQHQIVHEVLVVNDNSQDNTMRVIENLAEQFPTLKFVTNDGHHGYGYAVRLGLEKFTGDCVAIMMADNSDSPDDLVKFYQVMMEKKVDCVFGTRWSKGGNVVDYPLLKRIINRSANRIIRLVMNIRYNDTTNAFKMYKREVINGLKPILAPHFNLTIELPLKAIIRGYSYAIVPNSWINRKHGVSKLKIKEMGSRYFFILMYCFIEKYFSSGDFKKGKWEEFN